MGLVKKSSDSSSQDTVLENNDILSTAQKIDTINVALIGSTNAGRSTILKTLTGKKVTISDEPQTTDKPVVGVLNYKGVKIRVTEMPAINPYWAEDYPKDGEMLKSMDLAIIVTDTGAVDHIFSECQQAGIVFNYDTESATMKSIPAMIVINKADTEGFNDAYMNLASYAHIDLLPVSAHHDKLTALADAIWKHLGLTKIYLKTAGKKVDKNKPVCVKADSTIESLAPYCRKNFEKKFSHARVWGRSAKAPGMCVDRAHQLADEDTVEVVFF